MMCDEFVRGLAIVALLAVGSTAGCATASGKSGTGAKAANQYDSGWLPVGESPVRGPEEGEVTVVVFNDLLCESCFRVADGVETVREENDSVRVVFKHYPSEKEVHRLAARAAEIARSKDKFWEMHDAVLENRKAILEGDVVAELTALANDIGLDAKAFREQLASADEPASLERDVKLGRELGLKGPPVLFVNGERLDTSGEQKKLAEVVERKRDEVDILLKGKVERPLLYQTATALSREQRGEESKERFTGEIRPYGSSASERPRVFEDSEKIPVHGSPVLGPIDASVTVVAFMDLQCPFCKKAKGRLDRLVREYPEDVRIVFKHFPLPFHKDAKPAGRAVMAAGEQGKFWEMYDELYATMNEWRGGGVEKVASRIAGELELDVERFREDMSRDDFGEKIREDTKLGKKLGVKGTPGFFINGAELNGAQPYSRFKKLVDEQLAEVRKMRKSGVDTKDLYRRATAKNYAETVRERKRREKKRKERRRKRRRKKVRHIPVSDDDAVRGANADEALVTIVEFSDFECPFCSRASRTVEKVMENYGDNVRLVFKHRPLRFHKAAEPAARAAIAAQKQGKFWEMHDLLFENQKKLESPGQFEEFAEQLDLDVDQFEKDMESTAAKDRINDDTSLARKVGARGTPTFFINGVTFVGAKPYKAFEKLIDEQIEKAKEAKKSTGHSGEKLYREVVDRNRKEK